MAATATNFTLNPQDGWVALTSADVTAFLRIDHRPAHVPLVIAFGTSPPAASSRLGFRSDCGKFWVNGALGTGVRVYGRIFGNTNGPIAVSVFAN